MSFLSRFASTQKSHPTFTDDAGIPTKSGVVAGGNCENQIKECMASCEALDQDCLKVCGTAYQACQEEI